MGHHSSSRDHKERDKEATKERKHHRSSRDDDSSSRKKHRHSSSSKKKRDRSDEEDDDEWVEKGAPAASTSASAPPVDTFGTFTPGAVSKLRGDDAGLEQIGESITDGYGEGEDGTSGHGGRGAGGFGLGEDMFSSMGTERKRREPKEKPDPTQTMGQSSRELNKAHWQGGPAAADLSTPTTTRVGSPIPGSSGSSWRLMKLKRTYEMATEEGRDVEDVALERYDSLEQFHEAVEEKRILDERRSGRPPLPMGGGGGRAPLPPPRQGGGPATPGSAAADRRFVYTDNSSGSSRPPSRGSFRRPGEALERSESSQSLSGLAGHSSSSQQQQRPEGSSRPATPIPSAFTPPSSRTPRPSALSHSVVLNPDPTSAPTSAHPVLSQSDLNKLQAKVLKARLMGDERADELEKEYEIERVRTAQGGAESGGALGVGGGEEKVEMLPTVDGRGRLYDVGNGSTKEQDETDKERVEMGRRKQKRDKVFESHDPTTGELIRHNPDDDSQSLSELVRQERFSAGAQDQKSMDFEMASRIAGDGKFVNDLDYFDENAEKLARKKMKSDVLKKAFAVQDYAKTKKALDNCTLCFGDEGESPKSAMVALGTRAYLGLLDNEELVPGHCRIVPIAHHFSSLEADDETWDEIKNFMKTLMQMNAEKDKGVVFFESCISLKNQRHTCIEAVPVPFDLFDEIPAYFQEAIDNSEQEWSQHKKRIVFTSARPFRRSLVPNLPYFMVQWDYRGEKGYGHVIEGVDDAPDRDADGYEQRGEMGEKGSGEFPKWFATEIIGSVLELEPRQWRKPRRLDFRNNEARVAAFRKSGYDAVDWTKMLQKQ